MNDRDEGRQVLPIPDQPHVGLVTYDAKDPDTVFPAIEPLRPPGGAPNVLARTVGVIAATVSALGAFGTVQFQPFWNLLIIIVDIAVIWALTSHGRDIEKMRDASM